MEEGEKNRSGGRRGTDFFFFSPYPLVLFHTEQYQVLPASADNSYTVKLFQALRGLPDLT